jgi:hypothetical protein
MRSDLRDALWQLSPACFLAPITYPHVIPVPRNLDGAIEISELNVWKMGSQAIGMFFSSELKNQDADLYMDVIECDLLPGPSQNHVGDVTYTAFNESPVYVHNFPRPALRQGVMSAVQAYAAPNEIWNDESGMYDGIKKTFKLDKSTMHVVTATFPPTSPYTFWFHYRIRSGQIETSSKGTFFLHQNYSTAGAYLTLCESQGGMPAQLTSANILEAQACTLVFALLEGFLILSVILYDRRMERRSELSACLRKGKYRHWNKFVPLHFIFQGQLPFFIPRVSVISASIP